MKTDTETRPLPTGRLIESLKSHAEVIVEGREEVAKARRLHRKAHEYCRLLASEELVPDSVLRGLKSGELSIGSVNVRVVVKVWADIMDGKDKRLGHVAGVLNPDGTALDLLDLDDLDELRLRDPDGELRFEHMSWIVP